MKQGIKEFSLRRLVLAAAIMGPAMSYAAPQAGTVLVATQGVKAIGKDGTARELVRRSAIYAGDRLVTGSGARAQIKFTDGSIMGIKPNSEMSLDKYAYGEESGVQAMFMSLVKGGFRTVTGAIGKANRQDYKISTPVATIGIRGTLHEGDFNPETGLALGVWDGGTETCSSSGCLDLGAGSDYRFGFIGLDGRGEGRSSPPEGIGGDGDRPGGGDGLADLGGDRRDGNLADDSAGLFVADSDSFLYGQVSPAFSGFAVLGKPAVASTVFPWGAASTLAVNDAGVTLGTSSMGGAQVTDWWMKSNEAGGYINAGFSGPNGFTPAFPHRNQTADQTAEVIWGYWSGSNQSGDDVSFAAFAPGVAAGVDTDIGIPASGVFAFGTWASPTVIANLTGQIHFEMTSGFEVLSTEFFDLSGFAQTPIGSQGQLVVDASGGHVGGHFDFDTFNHGSWHVVLGGNLSHGNLNVYVVPGLPGSPLGTGSYWMATGGTPGSELAAAGTARAAFVGAGQNLGVLGAFDISTLDPLDDNFANGVFFMSSYTPVPKYTGFAALDAQASGSYSWSPATLLALDDARLTFGTDALANTVITDGALHVGAANTFILPGCFSCQSAGAVSYPPSPSFLNVPYDSSVRVAWGSWLGNDASLSAIDTGVFSANAVSDPGVWIVGDWASPAVIASLAGQVDFGVLSPFPAFIDASGVPQEASFGGGGMTILADGNVSGNLFFDAAPVAPASIGDQWNIDYTGTFNGSSAQPLTLSVVSNAVDPLSGSHFMSATGGLPLEVTGTIKAGFVGLTDVAGVVGAFDVKTVDAVDPNYASGVFAMTRTSPLP